jgi:NADH-quinone oxidoreductase subunit H
MTSAVIPWGDKFHLLEGDIILQATDIDVAYYIFGVMSMGVYGIMIGGWALNKFSLIGAVRAALKWYRMKLPWDFL